MVAGLDWTDEKVKEQPSQAIWLSHCANINGSLTVEAQHIPSGTNSFPLIDSTDDCYNAWGLEEGQEVELDTNGELPGTPLLIKRTYLSQAVARMPKLLTPEIPWT